MLQGVLALLGCQVAGEVVVRVTGLEFPAPVIGMLLFFAVLQLLRPADGAVVVQAPAALLRHLQLLFVPVGVGIVVYLDRLREDGVPLAAGLWASWALGFVVTALMVAGLLRIQRRLLRGRR